MVSKRPAGKTEEAAVVEVVKTLKDKKVPRESLTDVVEKKYGQHSNRTLGRNELENVPEFPEVREYFSAVQAPAAANVPPAPANIHQAQAAAPVNQAAPVPNPAGQGRDVGSAPADVPPAPPAPPPPADVPEIGYRPGRQSVSSSSQRRVPPNPQVTYMDELTAKIRSRGVKESTSGDSSTVFQNPGNTPADQAAAAGSSAQQPEVPVVSVTGVPPAPPAPPAPTSPASSKKALSMKALINMSGKSAGEGQGTGAAAKPPAGGVTQDMLNLALGSVGLSLEKAKRRNQENLIPSPTKLGGSSAEGNSAGEGQGTGGPTGNAVGESPKNKPGNVGFVMSQEELNKGAANLGKNPRGNHQQQPKPEKPLTESQKVLQNLRKTGLRGLIEGDASAKNPQGPSVGGESPREGQGRDVGSAPAPDSSAAAPAPDQVPVPTNLAVAASAQNSGEPPVRENSHVEGNKNKGAGTGTSTGSVGSSGKIQGNRGTSRPLPPIPMGSNSATTSAGNNPTATVGGESSPNPKVVPQGAPMPVDDIFGSDDEPSAFRFSGKPQDLTLGKPPVAASAQNSGEPSVRKNSPGKGKRNKGSGTGASTGSVGSDSGSDGENQVNESALPPLPPVPPPPPSVSQTGQNKGNGSPAKKTPVKQPGENKGRRSPSPESPVVKARQNHVTAASVLNAIGLQNKNVQPTTKSDAKQGAGLDAQQGTDNEDIIQRLMNRVKQSEQKEEEVKKDDEEEDDEWEEEEPERREQPKEEKTETSKANKSPEVEEDEGPLELLKRKLLDITRITPTKADNKRFKEGDIDKGEVEDFANLVGGAFSQCFQDANGVKAQSVKEILKIDWGKLLSFSAANAQNSITQYCTYHILWRLFIDTLCGPEQQMQAIFYPKAGPIDVERLSKLVANANTIESIQLQKNLPFSQMVDKIKEKTGLEQEKIEDALIYVIYKEGDGLEGAELEDYRMKCRLVFNRYQLQQKFQERYGDKYRTYLETPNQLKYRDLDELAKDIKEKKVKPEDREKRIRKVLKIGKKEFFPEYAQRIVGPKLNEDDVLLLEPDIQHIETSITTDYDIRQLFIAYAEKYRNEELYAGDEMKDAIRVTVQKNRHWLDDGAAAGDDDDDDGYGSESSGDDDDDDDTSDDSWLDD